MSYGHAQNLAGEPVGKPAADSKPAAPPVDPVLWRREDMRAALRARDIGRVYRLILEATGMSQHHLAELVGQAQSEVNEILKGRQVLNYDVLARIADRLGIPRELMGLSAYGPEGTYAGEVTVTNPPKGVNAEVLRRHVLALGAITAVGAPAVGELGELDGPSPVPLPSRLSHVHVAQVRDLTRRLGEAGNLAVSDPEVLSAAVAWATRLLSVPGTEPIKQALMIAVAELHIEAGWAGFEAARYERAMYHYARALELATAAGDAYRPATALNYAGLATTEHGHPNDGLKMIQFGQVKASDIPADEQRAVVVGVSGRAAHEACALVESAKALACLGCLEAAYREQGKARELWRPTRADPFGDVDRPAARLELERGRLDAAEPFAVASVRRWEGGSRTSRTYSGIVLATIHVRAGEPGGLRLAHGAITEVTKLSSVRARRRLEPLAAALEARPGSDARDLARTARQLTATQA